MSKGLGAAYMRKWRAENPRYDLAYRESYRGKYAQLKRGAKRRGVVLDLCFEEYESLMLRNPTCFYCLGPLSGYGYSLDRKDHQKGYTLDNVVVCCGSKEGNRDTSCNARKGRLEQIGFKYPRTVELMFELLGRKDA